MLYVSLIIRLLCKIQEELEIPQSLKEAVLPTRVRQGGNRNGVSSKRMESYSRNLAGTPLNLQHSRNVWRGRLSDENCNSNFLWKKKVTQPRRTCVLNHHSHSIERDGIDSIYFRGCMFNP